MNESFSEFKNSFFYGSRVDLNFKFLNDLSDENASASGSAGRCRLAGSGRTRCASARISWYTHGDYCGVRFQEAVGGDEAAARFANASFDGTAVKSSQPTQTTARCLDGCVKVAYQCASRKPTSRRFIYTGDNTHRGAPRMNENVRSNGSNGFSRLTTEVVTTNFIYTGV